MTNTAQPYLTASADDQLAQQIADLKRRVAELEGRNVLDSTTLARVSQPLTATSVLIAAQSGDIATIAGLVYASGVLSVPGSVHTSGWLRVGNPTYNPVNTNNLSVQGAIVSGGYMHPGNQWSYGFSFTSDFAGYTALYANHNFASAGAILCINWFRSWGPTGWYNQTYGGGIWMQGATDVEVYGGKNWFVPSGNVGYGVAPESNKRLVINGQNDGAGYHGIVVRNSSGANRMYVSNSGTENWVSSAWQIGSDAAFKQEIRTLDTSDRRGKNIAIVEYVRKGGSGRKEIGLIAQDVQRVYPEAVVTADDGTLAVIYTDVELAMIHDLRIEVATLREEIQQLRQRTKTP